MRPLNLIPPEQRRGDQAPLRSGPLAYILLGTLVALLAGVTALVLANNEISERESEVAALEVEDARERTKAERLATYTEFRNLTEQRLVTVASLADSRFDWERVMRELSLVLPRDVWLVSLTASAASGEGAEASGGGGGGSGLASSVTGPVLELSGCAAGQEGVAGFVTALKDIDGVTRVGVESSELGGASGDSGGGGGGGDSGSGGECQTRDFIAKFEIVVAFDAAPVSAPAPEGVAPATTATGEADTEGPEGE